MVRDRRGVDDSVGLIGLGEMKDSVVLVSRNVHFPNEFPHLKEPRLRFVIGYHWGNERVAPLVNT